MGKLAELMATGEITVEELESAPELIERAKLVMKGMKACRETILFPFGVSEMDCYSYEHPFKDYKVWGKCTSQGIFSCYTTRGGVHQIGEVNLTDPSDIFKNFDKGEFRNDLEKFLSEQIEKATKKNKFEMGTA